MKKIISIVMAVVLLMGTLSISTAAYAVTSNGTVKTVNITSESELFDQVDAGYKGYSTTLNGNTAAYYSLSVPNECYVFFNIVEQTSTYHGNAGFRAYLYSNDMSVKYFEEYYASSNGFVASTNGLVHLSKGNYIFYIETVQYAGITHSLTINAGLLPTTTDFLSATYMGEVSDNGQTFYVKVNSLDTIKEFRGEVSNGERGWSFGWISKHELDSNNCATFSLSGNQGTDSYSWLDLGVEDIYGIEHTVEYKILNPYTATVEGIKDKTYTGKAITQKDLTVYAGYKTSGAPNYSISYKNNVNVGTAQIIFTGEGNTIGSVTKTFKINPAAKIAAGKCNVKLSKTSYVYDGKVKTPAVTVKYGNNTLKNGTDYTVSYDKGRKNIGKYNVTITFKGAYSGKSVQTFTIKPKAPSISKLTAGKNKFTVKWSKVQGITGYEVQCALNNKFTTDKKTVKASAKTTSITVKSLKKKRTYYVRVRSYKTVGKKKIYSSWSKAKPIKTK